jgi:hypothetical protein
LQTKEISNAGKVCTVQNERELKKRTNEEEYPSAEMVGLNEGAGY